MSVMLELEIMTPEQYLKDELDRDIKHEFIDGHAHAMSGASRNHNRISRNVLSQLHRILENSPCEPFGSDMKVRVNDNFFYPDVLMVCDDHGDNKHYTDSPVIVVEVLSKSTRRKDETLKRQQYLSIPTLQAYVIIEQDVVDVEVVYRSDSWRSKRYYMGDEIVFETLGLILSVEDIYQRVQNEDVSDYLASKAEEAELAELAAKEAAQNAE